MKNPLKKCQRCESNMKGLLRTCPQCGFFPETKSDKKFSKDYLEQVNDWRKKTPLTDRTAG